MNQELPGVQAGFRKDRGTRDQIANIHLQPDILECEVKWALGSLTTNKASGGDEIPAELFEILRDDAVKVLHSNLENLLPANLENSAVAKGLEKVSFHSNTKDGQCQRMFSTLFTQLYSFHASKLMLKFLQARHQQYVNQELSGIQARFRKDRGTRDQIANIH